MITLIPQQNKYYETIRLQKQLFLKNFVSNSKRSTSPHHHISDACE